MKKLVLFAMVLAVALIGCSTDREAGTDGRQGTGDSPVVATAGSEKITEADVNALLAQIPEQARAQYSSPEGKREFVSGLAEIKMLSQEARKQGLDKKPEVVRKLDLMGDQVLAQALAETAIEGVVVSDEDVSRQYNDHMDQYATGPRAKLSHILVATEAEAKAVLERLKKGEDFAAVAREVSTCPSSERGGDLGWATRGMMVPEFDEAAFALEKGQLSQVVKTNYGFHVIRCEDVEPRKQMSLDEARPRIEQQLRSEKTQEAVEGLVERVKKEYPLTLSESYFADEQAAPGEGGPESEPAPSQPAAPADAE